MRSRPARERATAMLLQDFEKDFEKGLSEP